MESGEGESYSHGLVCGFIWPSVCIPGEVPLSDMKGGV